MLTGIDYYQEVPAIVGRMKAAGFFPNLVTLSTMLDASAQNGDIETAEKIFAEIGSDDFPVKPDLIFYSTMIHAYGTTASPPIVAH